MYCFENLFCAPTVSTPGSMVVAPPGEVLKFLLPGLCHLTADDKARRVLLDCDAHVTLMRYFHYRWMLFKSDGTSAQESEVREINHLHRISLFIAWTNNM